MSSPARDWTDAPATRAVLDTEDALERILGDATLYMRMLERYRRDYADSIPRLQQWIAAQDWDTAARHAHTLKGASGMVGASTVHLRAAEAEHCLRAAHDQAARAVEALAPALQTVLTLLESLPLAPAPALTPAPAADNAQLAALAALLDNGDGEVFDWLEEAGPALRARLGDTAFTALTDAVEACDFARARRCLPP